MVDYKDVDEFSNFKRKDKNKILKYIELCFSKDSPLNQIQNFRSRQIKAAQKSRLSTTDENVIKIMNFDDEQVNVLINTYVGKLQNSNFYDSLVSNQFLFWSIQEEMRKPLDSAKINERAALSKHSEVIEKRITDLTHKIYGYDEVAEAGAKVIRMSYEQRLKQRQDVS